mmetsp:Transcript_69570/g.125419  ORF Transcript_69570/g.125419 Transcript_69570/m.125419 type:complete len:206 (-) Transcript_69570:1498-2115(-)
MPCIHDPALVADCMTELTVMRNHNDSTSELLQASSQGAQRVSIQIIRRLIEDENVRRQPHGCSKYHLHLLPPREYPNPGVRGEARVQAKAGEMLLYLGLGQRARNEPVGCGLLLILALHHAQVAHLHHDFAWNPHGVLGGGETPLHLVFVFCLADGHLYSGLPAVKDELWLHCFLFFLVIFASPKHAVIEPVGLLDKVDILCLEV